MAGLYLPFSKRLCMTRKERILYLLILLFFVTLFFSGSKFLSIGADAAVVGYSFLFSPVSEKWQLLKKRRALQCMLLFFAWVVVSLFLSEHFHNGLSFLNPRLALF